VSGSSDGGATNLVPGASDAYNPTTRTLTRSTNEPIAAAHIADTSDAHAASAISVSAAGFDGNLSTTDTNLQLVAQKVDDLVAPGAPTNYLIAVRAAGTPQTIASSTLTTFLPTNSVTASGITWTHSTGRATITAAGKYAVFYNFLITEMAANTLASSLIQHISSGTTNTIGNSSGSFSTTGGYRFSASTVENMSVGDVVYSAITQTDTDGGAETMYGSFRIIRVQ
jgi:hypothetical protein